MRGDRPQGRLEAYEDPCPGLPRMRGDRPAGPVTTNPAATPVCAGIDPPAPRPFLLAKRLPRMRGDRPPPVRGQADKREATPYARDRPHPLWLADIHVRLPVCAGIDPISIRCLSTAKWLPRMRGDRPVILLLPVKSMPATPYARGSTWLLIPCPPPSPGYPVCAGIDRALISRGLLSGRLPRMRGDRPHLQGHRGIRVMATPYAHVSHVICGKQAFRK